MPMRLRFQLTGIALILGGLIGGICHWFNFDSPRDATEVVEFARFNEPLHVVLFAGGMVVLLGWFGQYALQCTASGSAGFAAFVSLFLGILCGDLLHCVLEFSVFPVLTAVAPYALPGLEDATYRSGPLSVLLMAGQCLMFVGVAAAAYTVSRSRIVPQWAALPFGATALLLVLRLIPQLAAMLGALSSMAIYISLAILGLAILRSTPQSAALLARSRWR